MQDINLKFTPQSMVSKTCYENKKQKCIQNILYKIQILMHFLMRRLFKSSLDFDKQKQRNYYGEKLVYLF